MSYFVNVVDADVGANVYAVAAYTGVTNEGKGARWLRNAGKALERFRNANVGGVLNLVVGEAISNPAVLGQYPMETAARFYVRPNRTPISISSSDPQFFLSAVNWGEKKYLAYNPTENVFSPSATESPAASKYNVLRIAAPAATGYRAVRRCVVSEDGSSTTDNKYATIRDFDANETQWSFMSYPIASTVTPFPQYGRLVFSCDQGSGPVRGDGHFHHIRSVATGSELYALTNGSAAAAMTPLSFVNSSLLNNTTTSFTFIPRQVPGVDGATKYTYSIKTGAVDEDGTPLYLCMNEADDPNDWDKKVYTIQLRPEYDVWEWEEWEVVPTTIGANFGRFRLVSTAFPSQCLCCPPSAGIALAANLDSSTAVAQGYADFEIFEFKPTSTDSVSVAVAKGDVEAPTVEQVSCCGAARLRLAAVIVSLILIVSVIIVFAFPETAAAAMSFF